MNHDHRRASSGLVALAVAIGTAVAAPLPAVASDSVSISTPATLYQGSRLCYDVPVSYSVTIPSDAAQWSLDIDGLTAGGATTFTTVGNSTSQPTGAATAGVVAVRLCPPTHRPGPITFTATGQYYTANQAELVTLEPVTASATIVKSPSRVAFRMRKKSANFGEKVPFRVRVTQRVTRLDGTSGWGPAADVKVILQEQIGTRWRRLGTGYVDANGLWRQKLIMGRPSSGTFRVRVPGSTVKASVSETRTVS